jgi:uncharacterized membrane protein required for colicin V production
MSAINWVAFGGLLVDLVIIGIIISNAFWGYRRGLVNVIFQALAFIVSLLIMFVLYKPVANMIMENTSLDERLSAAIEANLTGTTLESGDLIQAEQSNISTSVVELINSFVTEALQKAESNVMGYVSTQLAKTMIYTGTMLLLFIISRFLLVFVRVFAELIGNLPIIKMINKSGGLVYGIVKAFVVIYAVLAILSVVSPFASQLGIIAAIQDSHLGSAMYNNNFILKFFF